MGEETSQHKITIGAEAIYRFPRMKRGFVIPPEKVVVKNIYASGHIIIQFKNGKKRQVRMEMLELINGPPV